MPDWTFYKAELQQLLLKPKFERMIHVSAIITELLAEYDIRPIIVGGLGVEIYTMNGYTTQDVDFVMRRNDHFATIMQEIGFQQAGKDWVHHDLGISVEVPGEELAGDMKQIVEVSLDTRKIYVIGVEDLILDRLRAAVHWKSLEDAEWGFRLIATYHEELNKEYLRAEVANQPQEQQELERWLSVFA